MQEIISKDVVEKWLTGWSISRGLPLPSTFLSGFKVEVNNERQKIRYVFPNLNDDFFLLARTVVEPWVFLKVCAPPENLIHLLPPRWVIQPQGYMMHCYHPMSIKTLIEKKEFKLELEESGATYFLKIKDNLGHLAACGRVIFIDDVAFMTVFQQS